MQQYLNSTSERERAILHPDEYVEALKTGESGAGTRAKGEEGSRGSDLVRRSNRSYAIQGSLPVNDVRLARAESIRDARDFGMVGLLRSAAEGDPTIAAAPFGDSLSAGADAESAYGTLWGSELGVARGSGGFGHPGSARAEVGVARE